ncbi:hypothetical protein B0H19DRAFT_1249413 [Mycena capillaripes]|nr:hypothetical protein B0H19DRAFT_1249413 [Mycena capillaripes]
MASAEEISIVQVFVGLRYFSGEVPCSGHVIALNLPFEAVPFVSLIFDHIITIGEELNTIWNNPYVRWPSKAAFLVNRYLTEAIIAYVIYIFSGMSTSLSTTSFFDFALIVFLIFNAMDRPRVTDVQIVSGLLQDGVGFFLAIFGFIPLRFADLVVSIFQESAEVFLAITTVWAFCTIINARLHMRLEGLVLNRFRGPVIMLEDM